MTHQEQLELVRRALEGDQNAFTALYERFRPYVVSAVRRRIHDVDAQDDLIQTTFIRAFEALHTFRGDAAFGTWITRIAINVCLSHRRAEKTRASYVTILEDLEFAKAALTESTSIPAPDDLVADAERRALILEGIDRLPERYRKAMWLRYVKDRSYEEIVSALQVPMGTVKTWLRRARQQLAVEFRRLGIQPV